MAPSPIVTATIQTAIINAVSNILAQAITAHQSNKPFTLDWTPAIQFFLYGLVSTPPNFLWQDLLETSFPAYQAQPSSPARDDDDDNNKSAAAAEQPRLNKRNTLVKTLLDQTVGTALNTLFFSIFMHGLQAAAMAHREEGTGGSSSSISSTLAFLAGRAAGVRYADVWAKARAEFWGLVKASWRFWPVVSLVNYVFLTSVEARSLLGSLAGLGWGVYVCLYAGR
ncbi:hypothetical protein VTK56DRAFT_9477 [Thermocarpiscus australiensis]